MEARAVVDVAAGAVTGPPLTTGSSASGGPSHPHGERARLGTPAPACGPAPEDEHQARGGALSRGQLLDVAPASARAIPTLPPSPPVPPSSSPAATANTIAGDIPTLPAKCSANATSVCSPAGTDTCSMA